MLKKSITYETFDGEKRTKDFYFNISKSEIGSAEMSAEGGLEKLFRDLISERDQKKQAQLFENIILMAYGEVSKDGDYFVKVDENGHRLSDKFKQSAAYDALFIELAQNTNEFVKFVIGIIPKEFGKALTDAGWDKKDFSDPKVLDAVVEQAKLTETAETK